MTVTRFDSDATETIYLRDEKPGETKTTKVSNWLYDIGTRVVIINQDTSMFRISVVT